MNIGSWALLLLCVLRLHFGRTAELTLTDVDLVTTNVDLVTTHQLTVTGTPRLGAERFTIEIGHGNESIAMHMDVRFKHLKEINAIVVNSKINDTWFEEKRGKTGFFPFYENVEFKVIINFDKDQFDIKANGNDILLFPNRFGDDKFMFIQVYGNLTIKGFSID